jgi:hypothetical protein
MQPSDLIRYGMIPEFVGRLAVVSVLNDLDVPALIEKCRATGFEAVELRTQDQTVAAPQPPTSWGSPWAETSRPRAKRGPFPIWAIAPAWT